jgi:glyoxylase-like metal-dependent hydrolase (beta-lactamase superfamily II)
MEITYELEDVTPLTVANVEGEGHGNVGALSLRNFAIAIDSTMYSVLAKEFRKNIEKRFNKPVKYLIITHYHGDHIFGINAFKDVCVLSSEATSMVMKSEDVNERYLEYIKELEKEDPLGKGIEYLLPTLLFKKSVIIQDEDLNIEVIHVGGHTIGSSYVYFPHERVLFAGDLIFENMFPYAGDESCNPDLWINSLETMYSLNPKYIVPGHGPLMEGKDSLKKHITFFKNLRKIIKDAIKDNLELTQIDIPNEFEVVNEELKPLTINRFLDFYKNK